MEQLNTQKKYSNWLEMLNVIVKTTKNLTHVESKNRKLTKILRNIYSLVILFFYSISFVFLIINNKTLSQQTSVKQFLIVINIALLFIGIIDYMLWWTLSLRNEKPFWHFLLFPIKFKGLLLLAIILPSLHAIELMTNQTNDFFTSLRYFSFIRLARLAMLMVLFTPFEILFSVFKKEKYILTYTFVFVIVIILIFSMIFYNLETDWEKTMIFMPKEGQTKPDGNQFFKSIYFTTVAMTTIGFGDLSPTTQMGRLMVIILSLIGIAVFAIPSGVIAGAFLQELKVRIKANIDSDPEHKNSKLIKIRNALSSKNKRKKE